MSPPRLASAGLIQPTLLEDGQVRVDMGRQRCPPQTCPPCWSRPAQTAPLSLR